MAESTKQLHKNTKLSRSFKGRLEKLGCPYTEGVDESWILELVFKPGEPRIRLLQWLFSKFDSKLNDILDPQYAPIESRMDSRIQRLLYVSSTLGLSREDDVDLIRGVTTGSRQTSYMDELLDLVCIADISEDPRAKLFQSPGVISEACDLYEQFAADSQYVDQLVLGGNIATLFNSKVHLLPADINKTIEAKWIDNGFTKEKPPAPDINNLIEQANTVAGKLDRQNLTLQELIETFDFSEPDSSILSTTKRTLKVVLSELSQLVVSFMYCYENEMRLWCNKTPPVLTQLGVAFKRVYNVLKQLVEFLKNVDGIKQSYSSIGPDVMDKLTTNNNLVHSGQMALENVQECVNILDESIQRDTDLLSMTYT